MRLFRNGYHLFLSLVVFVVFLLVDVFPSGTEASEVSSENDRDCIVRDDGSLVCFDDDGLGGDDASMTTDENNYCHDGHEQCSFWADHGECEANPGYMLSVCAKSCNSCENSMVEDHCRGLAKQTLRYGEWQNCPDATTKQTMEIMHRYMMETVFTDEKFLHVKDKCRNQHEDCTHWASLGECNANPKYMQISCAPSCQTCEMVDFDTRCPFDKDAPLQWQQPGDVHRYFEQLLQANAQYKPVIHSGPAQYTKVDPNKDGVNAYNYTVAESAIVDGPWVITLENVLTDEECEKLIELGAQKGFERSMDVGQEKLDGTYDAYENKRRTSTNAWCSEECFDDPIVQDLSKRIEEDIVLIPTNNSEYMQILKYEEGQEYMEHHDYIPYQLHRAMGVRILTVFCYLYTVPNGSGGTRFPKLNNLTIQPVKGRVLIWPSVKDDDPNAQDPRTNHQALPVEGEGNVKYAANLWYHQRDYRTPHEENCQ